MLVVYSSALLEAMSYFLFLIYFFLAGRSLSGWPELVQILEALYCVRARQCCKFPLEERREKLAKAAAMFS